MSLVKEFKEFAVRGNAVDMAVGILVGAAFGELVKNFVEMVVMPPMGMLIGGVDFSNLFLVLKAGDPAGPYPSVKMAEAAGAVIVKYGAFTNLLVNFMIVAFVVFLVVRSINKLRGPMPKE